MRALLSLRFVATIAALVGLTVLAWLAVGREGTTASLLGPARGSQERTVNLLSRVFKTTAGPGFQVAKGRTTAPMVLILDATRRMEIAADTPAEITCGKMGEIGQCAVAAQLLGDAVVWFALVPALPRNTLVLPGIKELRADNVVLLYNGWLVKRSAIVERICDTETDSLGEFMDTFGDQASATYNFDTNQISRVTCPKATKPTSTDPSTTVPSPETTVPPVDIIPSDSVEEGVG